MGTKEAVPIETKKIKNPKQEKYHEKNLSTQEKTEEQSTRFPQKNGNDRRQKRIEET